MPAAEFACPTCKTAFLVEPGTVDATAICPGCASSLEAHFYPAFFRPPEPGVAASQLTDLSEASCFYHPQKQAARVCDGCGRLLCALCSVDLGDQHLCPACISSGRKKGRIKTLETSRTRFDSIALSLAVGGCFLSIFSFVLAPAAIYLTIRHWNSPQGALGGGKTRFVFAVIIAGASLLVWGSVFGAALFGASTVHHHHHP
jgi:hypothetical protein